MYIFIFFSSLDWVTTLLPPDLETWFMRNCWVDCANMLFLHSGGLESDRGSAYKAASFNSCVSHRFRIPIALFHRVHPCPRVRRTGRMERAHCMRPFRTKERFLTSQRSKRSKDKKGLWLDSTAACSFGFNPSGVQYIGLRLHREHKSWRVTWVGMLISSVTKLIFNAPNSKHNSWAWFTFPPVWNQFYIWTSAAGPPTPFHVRT